MYAAAYPKSLMGLLLLFVIAYGLLSAVAVGGTLWKVRRPRRKTLGVALAQGGPGDPADLGLAATEVCFNLSDDSASPGWIVQGNCDSGPVAIVVHGHHDSRFGAIYRAQMLEPYVHATVLFDLPGHGNAAAADCCMGEREAADVLAVARGLPAELVEHRGVVLVGYSMGGTIVLRAAAGWENAACATDPLSRAELPLLCGVIAKAPYRRWEEGLAGQIRRRLIPPWLILPPLRWVCRLPGSKIASLTRDHAQDAAGLDVPLLVLHGDMDRICPLAAGRAIAEAAPQGELFVVQGGTHNQLLGADYTGVHDALRRFFAKLTEAQREAEATKV